jgi:hypothetical protein
MAEREMLVRTEMPLARSRIIRARPRPALPTTKPSRMNKMMPRMVKMLGVNTPAKVPSEAFILETPDFLSGSSIVISFSGIKCSIIREMVFYHFTIRRYVPSAAQGLIQGNQVGRENAGALGEGVIGGVERPLGHQLLTTDP